MSNIIAIVGRPNVGKSTFFNRLAESRKAIVADVSGITRDRHYAEAIWNGHHFMAIDTGGYVANSGDIYEKAIREQVDIAINEADCLVFMVDNTCGITDEDMKFAEKLRKIKKKVFVAANKVDNSKQLADANVYYKFGLGDIYPISSMTGSGTGELLDEIVKIFEKKSVISPDNLIPKLAIVGKPNVGKSSLLNALIGEPRTIVTPIPGTTRDSIHTHYKAYGHDFILIDTAGLRKKTKVIENIEFFSGIRTINTINECDICLLMIDALEGIGSQDLNILHLAEKQGKGIILLINKWDLITKQTNTPKEIEKTIKEKTKPFTDYPVIFISALNKQRIFKVMQVAMEIYTNRKKKLTTAQLKDAIMPVIDSFPPSSYRGKHIKIRYLTQLPTKTPVFAVYCNNPDGIKDSYKRFIENKLRESFNFCGVPIKLSLKKK